MKFYVLDERHVWYEAIIEAAQRYGLEGQRIFRGEEVTQDGYGFIRCHAEPEALRRNQRDFDLMSSRLTMIQDESQVRVYENKSAQFERWSKWMPPTWRFTDRAAAVDFILARRQFPLVSKADVGASSVNVRILRDRTEALTHVEQLFGYGVKVKHCAGSAYSLQRGYALLQEFIEHDCTWRVNAIGRHRAIFKRFNYPDRPVAQTGNVEPVMEMTPHAEAVLRFANLFFAEAGTNWCAVDILQKSNRLFLLETSLAWPWPSPGKCNDAPIFGSGKKWIQMFDVMFDELQAGVWQKK